MVVIYWTDLFSMEIHKLSGVTRNNEFCIPTRQRPSWGALKNEREMFKYLRQKMYPLVIHMKMFSLDQIFVSLVARGNQRVSSIRASVGMTLLSVAASVRPPLVHLDYLYLYFCHICISAPLVFCICLSDKSSNKRMNTISVRIAPLSLAASVWAPLVYLASFVPAFR